MLTPIYRDVNTLRDYRTPPPPPLKTIKDPEVLELLWEWTRNTCQPQSKEVRALPFEAAPL